LLEAVTLRFDGRLKLSLARLNQSRPYPLPSNRLFAFALKTSAITSFAVRIFPPAAGLLLLAANVSAQDAIQSGISQPSYTPLGQREIEILQSGPSAATSPATAGSGTLTQTPRRFQYSLTFTERTVFDDNIDINHVNRMSDVYFSLEPTLTLGFGGEDAFNSIRLIYRPTISVFVNNSAEDAVQHIIRLQGSHSFGHLLLALAQDLQILDGVDLTTLYDQTGHNANIDVGARSRHNVYTTNVNGSYQLTGKLFLTSGGTLSVDDYFGQEIGSQNVSGNLFLNYQYREKLVVGVGGTGGYNTVDTASPDQVFEQANVRVGYTATAKINFSATAGFEFRQFENGSRGLYVTPVYGLTASYAPLDGTSISLTGSRRIDNSASLAGQDYTNTLISGSVQQRFLQRCFIGFAAGYENSNYFSTTSGSSGTRNDDYYFIEPSVDVNITRYWNAGAYYLRRQNTSSLDSFSFYDNQVGVRTVLTF
jgi:hypothetical protein